MNICPFICLIAAAACVRLLGSDRLFGGILTENGTYARETEASSPPSKEETDDQEEYRLALAIESFPDLRDTAAPSVEASEERTDVSSYNAGDVRVLNETSYEPDYAALLEEPLHITAADPSEPAVLIIHTHASEAYTPTEDYSYTPTDTYRTTDPAFNVIRVGDELESVLESAGINVYHERTLFDHPSYNGSYTRALEATERILAEHPSIQIIFDVHRDAVMTSDGEAFGSVCRLDGEECAQILLIAGTGEGGLPHPDWRENLKLALRLERMMEVKYPGLLRNLNLRTERFNQHAAPGSLIVEVGCNGNTLEQALGAVRHFGSCAAEVIKYEIPGRQPGDGDESD